MQEVAVNLLLFDAGSWRGVRYLRPVVVRKVGHGASITQIQKPPKVWVKAAPDGGIPVPILMIGLMLVAQ